MVDWSDGQYELTAQELEPSARQLVERAGPVSGERALDLGCGTGNVALLAAERGAQVTAVDPASRLLDVVAARACESGARIVMANGRAEAIPAEDRAFDVALSHFALIFCEDEVAAMRELRRVLRLGGRLAFTAWLAEGPVHGALQEVGKAMAAAAPEPTPESFAWRDPQAVHDLVAGYFERVEVSRNEAIFEAPSIATFFDEFLTAHPVGRQCAKVLGEAGTLTATLERAAAVMGPVSDAGLPLRLKSPYVIVCAA